MIRTMLGPEISKMYLINSSCYCNSGPEVGDRHCKETFGLKYRAYIKSDPLELLWQEILRMSVPTQLERYFVFGQVRVDEGTLGKVILESPVKFYLGR